MPPSPTDTGFAARQTSYEALLTRAKNGESLKPAELKQMERFEAELRERSASELPVLLSLDEATAYSGYAGHRTIYEAVKNRELARLSDGSFDRTEIERWLAEDKKRQPNEKKLRELLGSQGGAEEDEEKPEFDSAAEEARYRHFRAKKEEIAVRRLRGELIEIAAVNEAFRSRVYEVKSGLLLLKRRVAHKLAEVCAVEIREVEKLLDAEVDGLLTAFSRKVEIDDRNISG